MKVTFLKWQKWPKGKQFQKSQKSYETLTIGDQLYSADVRIAVSMNLARPKCLKEIVSRLIDGLRFPSLLQNFHANHCKIKFKGW